MAKQKKQRQGKAQTSASPKLKKFIHIQISNEEKMLKAYPQIEIVEPLRLSDLCASVFAGIEELAFAAHIEFMEPHKYGENE